MEASEYHNLERIEREHWFYAGKREIVRYWLGRYAAITPQRLLLDCGAGTGAFAEEMGQLCRVIAIDDHDESLALARKRLGAERVREGSCTQLPMPDQSADMLTALDVLEHVENDRAAIAEFVRVLKPNGIGIVTVPALAALWSDWDEALHHFRRYDGPSLLDIFAHPKIQVEHWNYINVLALPLVFLVRGYRRLTRSSGSRMEDVIPPPILNRALQSSFTALACQEHIHFPAGVGLLLVFRRKA